MKNDALIFALNDVSDAFILSAGGMKPRRTARRIGLILLAAALAAMVTLGTAIAVSEEVREAVFGLFRVAGTVDVSEARDRLDEGGDPEPWERTPEHSRSEFVVMEGLTAENYRIEGYYEVWRGFFDFISQDWRVLSVYYPKDGELRKVTDWHEVKARVKGVDVEFKWFEYDGNIFVLDRYMELHDHDSLPEFSEYPKPGIGDKIFIEVREADGDLGLPLAYDINTGEITDLFANRKWEIPERRDGHFYEMTFTPDLKYMLFNVSAYENVEGEGLYLADLGSGRLYDLRELSGMEKVSGAWLYKSQAVVCWYLSPDHRYDIRALELGSGRVLTELEGLPMVHTENWSQDYSWELAEGLMTPEEVEKIGYGSALQTGVTNAGVGEKAGLYLIRGARSAAWIDESRNVELVDLLTGERYEVPGLKIPENMYVDLYANARGDKLVNYDTYLIDEPEPESRDFKVLDLEAHTCTVVNVERGDGFEYLPTPEFFGSGDKLALATGDIHYEDGEGYYSYVYIYTLK